MARTRKENGEGSTRKLESGKWECLVQSRYINPKTLKPKRIKRQGKTESEARKNALQELKRWEKGIEGGKDQKVDKKKTFGQYMSDFIDAEVSKGITDSSFHSYVLRLRQNFYNFPIANLQLQMLSKIEFQNYYKKKKKTKSYKTCMFPRQLCIRCCKWLISQSLLDENYAEQATLTKEISDEYNKELAEKDKTRKQVFSADDIRKFYEAYKNGMGQYPVVVLFLLETGMRASEFASLRNGNISMETNRIDIVETRALRFKDNNPNGGTEEYIKVPKNKQPRFVMMSDLCRECVAYMQTQTRLYCKNNPDDLLYPTFSNGKRRTNTSMEICFKRLCDKLGIDRDVRMRSQIGKNGKELQRESGLCLHSLRHTSDTIANSARGANVINTALMMGHTAITTENIYTHPTEEGLQSVTTPSQAVLENYKKKDSDDSSNIDLDKTKELFEMYQKLKAIFE